MAAAPGPAVVPKKMRNTGHGQARHRSRSTPLDVPVKTCRLSPSETTNSGHELNWFEPELSRRGAAVSAAQTR
ncbi:hypothetical protein L3X38_022977 [Prunus dulcis]|uniref:Uncharacterized protein n=1 Tax=Prunus dulcis TaxID=3755 RepID=A0AAD4VY45_PRUDU|nr:hypothetical protein L3X38_022977 [Prunus dulcis]